MAIFAQHFAQDELVYRVIFHHQHAQWARARLPRSAGRAVGVVLRRRQGQGQTHPKQAALAHVAFNPDRAPHGLHNAPRNAQPQPRALGLHARGQIKAHEILENMA